MAVIVNIIAIPLYFVSFAAVEGIVLCLLTFDLPQSARGKGSFHLNADLKRRWPQGGSCRSLLHRKLCYTVDCGLHNVGH